uniref:Uncharacterized protein n=1 Tax=Anguilla anguilla TaxID=7936 RepID=A0A0E9SMK6_ANGAN
MGKEIKTQKAPAHKGTLILQLHLSADGSLQSTTVYRVRGKIIHHRCYIVPYYL